MATEKATPAMSEIGYTGQAMNSYWIQSEARRELQFPYSIKTYNKMMYNSSVIAALKLVKTFFSRVEWSVIPFSEQSVHKKRAEFVTQCMDDMDSTWIQFIQEVSSVVPYGFSFHEIVARRRYRAEGSKHNDGFVGIKNLPIRSQDSIVEFLYDSEGRYLTGIKQSVMPVLSSSNVGSLTSTPSYTPVEIPISKMLHFRTDSYKDSPVGVSCLNGCYETWKWLNVFREIEAIGVSRNMSGVPHFELPPEYMDVNASPDKKAVYEMCKRIITNMSNGEQAGLITPVFYDDQGKKLFDFSLLTATGGSGVDTGSIITRYTNELYQALFSDILQMGSSKAGSNALAENKTSLVEMMVDLRLREITDVLNNKLIPFIFEQNGWDLGKLPKFKYGSILKPDIGVIAKAIQQISAVGLMEIDRPLLNFICGLLGLPQRDADEPVDFSILSNKQSGAGGGYGSSTGGLSGSGNSVSPIDNSADNLSNK